MRLPLQTAPTARCAGCLSRIIHVPWSQCLEGRVVKTMGLRRYERHCCPCEPHIDIGHLFSCKGVCSNLHARTSSEGPCFLDAVFC